MCVDVSVDICCTVRVGLQVYSRLARSLLQYAVLTYITGRELLLLCLSNTVQQSANLISLQYLSSSEPALPDDI
jgi:hypothetical protein